MLFSIVCVLSAVFPPPAPVLEWEKLFVEAGVFPTGWKRGELREVCISAPLDSGCDHYKAKAVSYRKDETSYAVQEIRFYTSEETATDGYPEWRALAFYEYANATGYTQPKEIIFQSDTVEQVHIGCNERLESGRKNCVFLAQYGHFIVRFALWDAEEIDHALFQGVIAAVDRKMSKYENEPPLTADLLKMHLGSFLRVRKFITSRIFALSPRLGGVCVGAYSFTVP